MARPTNSEDEGVAPGASSLRTRMLSIDSRISIRAVHAGEADAPAEEDAAPDEAKQPEAAGPRGSLLLACRRGLSRARCSQRRERCTRAAERGGYGPTVISTRVDFGAMSIVPGVVSSETRVAFPAAAPASVTVL